MATIQSLPKEVLVLVFMSLSSMELIGECRMVCKSWNDPAAIAMFRRPLHLCLRNRIKAEKLIRYLTTNPTKGQHVNYLSVCHYQDSVLEAVLPLLFTPNIRKLLGCDDTREILYRLITEIAQKSAVKFDKLNDIPYSCHFTESYSKALWTFKESLTDMDITLQEIPDSPTHLIDKLNEFKNLTMLTLEVPFDNAVELERMTGGCLQLQHLQLNTSKKIAYNDTPADDITTVSICPLDYSSILQVNCLQTLHIVSAGYPHFVSYLLCKYPNMQNISINICETDTYIAQCIEHLLKSLNQVPNYYLTYRTPAEDPVTATVFNAAKSNCNIVNIGYHHVSSDASTFMMTIEKNQTEQTVFSMQIPPNANTLTHSTYLSNVSIHINGLNVDMFNHRDFDKNDSKSDLYKRIAVDDEVTVLFNILFEYCDVEHISIIARDMSNCTRSHFFGHQTRLKSLEICTAQLSSATFLALTDMCRDLRVLNLINCPILPRDGIVRINMEHNTFQQLTYQLKACNDFVLDMGGSENKIAVAYAENDLFNLEVRYTQETYLWLQTKKSNRAMFLKIMPTNENNKNLISKKEFYLRPPKAPAIQISCFSVQNLLLDLYFIYLQLDEEYIEYALKCPVSSDYDSYYSFY